MSKRAIAICGALVMGLLSFAWWRAVLDCPAAVGGKAIAFDHVVLAFMFAGWLGVTLMWRSWFHRASSPPLNWFGLVESTGIAAALTSPCFFVIALLHSDFLKVHPSEDKLSRFVSPMAWAVASGMVLMLSLCVLVGIPRLVSAAVRRIHKQSDSG